MWENDCWTNNFFFQFILLLSISTSKHTHPVKQLLLTITETFKLMKHAEGNLCSIIRVVQLSLSIMTAQLATNSHALKNVQNKHGFFSHSLPKTNLHVQHTLFRQIPHTAVLPCRLVQRGTRWACRWSHTLGPPHWRRSRPSPRSGCSWSWWKWGLQGKQRQSWRWGKKRWTIKWNCYLIITLSCHYVLDRFTLSSFIRHCLANQLPM